MTSVRSTLYLTILLQIDIYTPYGDPFSEVRKIQFVCIFDWQSSVANI